MIGGWENGEVKVFLLLTPSLLSVDWQWLHAFVKGPTPTSPLRGDQHIYLVLVTASRLHLSG